MISYKICATQCHPQNPSDGIAHLPGLSKSQVWLLVNEAYDVLSNLFIFSLNLRSMSFVRFTTDNPETKDIFDRYGEEGLKSGTTYHEAYVYQGDPMKTYK